MSISIDPSQRASTLLPNASEESSINIVKGINEKIMSGGPRNRNNLHAKVSQLPFYNKLTDGTISAHELVQHFVNQKKIFETLETLIKVDSVFSEVITEEIFRTETIETDIRYFEEQFQMKRSPATKETENFVAEIKEKVAAEKTHLFAYTYVQYAGLFLGRSIAGKTEKWLKENIEDYSSDNPATAGLAYWQFENMDTAEQRKDYQKILVNFFSNLPLSTEEKESLIETGENAFIHNGNVLESVKPLKKYNWTLMTAIPLGIAAAGVAASFLINKYSGIGDA